MSIDPMVALTLKVTCPYCNDSFLTCEPEEEEKGQPMGQPVEAAECVPYTRDIGRFDPEGEEEWFTPKGWSPIGKDFLQRLGWERIGILRTPSGPINVQ